MTNRLYCLNRVMLIQSLRERLDAGVYHVPPDLLAERIIWRALHFQAVRHVRERPRSHEDPLGSG
jgi:hypothetical protein